VCALASLASAVPLIRLRYEQPRHTRPVSGSGARQVSEGLRALGADTGLRLIAPLGFVQTFLRGCATVLVVVVAIDLLGGGDADLACSTRRSCSARWSDRCSPRQSPWNGRHARCLGVVL
jgi:hypothetical protein